MHRPALIRLVPSPATVTKDMSWTPINATAMVRYCGLHSDDAIPEKREREQNKEGRGGNNGLHLKLRVFPLRFSSTYSSKEDTRLRHSLRKKMLGF